MNSGCSTANRGIRPHRLDDPRRLVARSLPDPGKAENAVGISSKASRVGLLDAAFEQMGAGFGLHRRTKFDAVRTRRTFTGDRRVTFKHALGVVHDLADAGRGAHCGSRGWIHEFDVDHGRLR